MSLSHITACPSRPTVSHNRLGHPLTCGNVENPGCPTPILSHTTTHSGVAKYIAAGHSVIHRQNPHGNSVCPNPPGTAPDLRKHPTVPPVDNSETVAAQPNSAVPRTPYYVGVSHVGHTPQRDVGPGRPGHPTSHRRKA